MEISTALPNSGWLWQPSSELAAPHTYSSFAQLSDVPGCAEEKRKYAIG
jgi:hypothetical protein